MNKRDKKRIAGLLTVGLMVNSVLTLCQPERTLAAAKIKVGKTKVTVTVGKTVKASGNNTGSVPSATPGVMASVHPGVTFQHDQYRDIYVF